MLLIWLVLWASSCKPSNWSLWCALGGGGGCLYSNCSHNYTVSFLDADWEIVQLIDLLQDNMSLFEEILFHKVVRSNSSLDQVRNQNIGAMTDFTCSFCRYKIYLSRWVLCLRNRWRYIVITSPLFTLNKILSFVRRWSI